MKLIVKIHLVTDQKISHYFNGGSLPDDFNFKQKPVIRKFNSLKISEILFF